MTVWMATKLPVRSNNSGRGGEEEEEEEEEEEFFHWRNAMWSQDAEEGGTLSTAVRGLSSRVNPAGDLGFQLNRRQYPVRPVFPAG